ncbi:hypothetical protein B0H17DRAFT_1177403 [Mycena rosella]|uniref:Uncharacterized protein n=1 Tax=Mycena rosella TaxID=1033263 RepID=A0AAD7DRT8_MYCRO|nr:hypothetical protein B0H17DRAFT_1177403 [Mycena rosella]
MPNPDWSKVDGIRVHGDSPWLTTPPTEKGEVWITCRCSGIDLAFGHVALAEYCPDTVFYRSEVRDSEAFVVTTPNLATEVGKRTLFGHPKDVQPTKPPLNSFIFKPEERSTAPAPPETVLISPKLEPHHPEPPRNFLHPRAGIFTLKKTSAYQRGYVHTTPYYLSSKEGHRERMMRVVVM